MAGQSTQISCISMGLGIKKNLDIFIALKINIINTYIIVVDDAEKIRNFDKLSFEEICKFTGQDSGDFLEDAIPLDINLTLINADALIEDVIQLLKDNKVFKRTRNFNGHLKMLLANLFKANFLKDRYYIYYSRSPTRYKNVKRYNPNDINYKPLMNVIEALQNMDLVETSIGFYDKKTQKGKRSRIRMSFGFEELFNHHFITPSNLHRVSIDSIRLKDSTKQLVDYEETPLTRQMRKTVKEYNALLLDTNIAIPFKSDVVKEYLKETVVDFANNTYHRIFNNNSFESGGRFYGPWWQSINSELRKLITFNNKKTIELDYSSLHIHLLYSKEGIDYHELYGKKADPYLLKGYGKRYRTVIKRAFLIALNMQTPKNFSQTVAYTLREEGIFKKDISYKDILSQFFTLHPKIKKYFFTGIGTELQYIDSCITDSIVRRMCKLNIPLLGVHDSFIVEEKYKSILEEYMYDSFIENKLVSIPSIAIK